MGEMCGASVQASETGLFRRRKKYHTPQNMTRRPRRPNSEPSAMATMELGFDLSDDVRVAFAVDEAIMGPDKVVVVGVGDREEDVEELVSVALVKLP